MYNVGAPSGGTTQIKMCVKTDSVFTKEQKQTRMMAV